MKKLISCAFSLAIMLAVPGMALAGGNNAMKLAGTSVQVKKSGKHHAGETFRIASNCKIHTPSSKHGTVADLKIGDKVRISYLDQGGTKVAGRISVKGKHAKGEKKKGAPKQGGTKHGGKKKEYQHAKGTITSIDASTITIKPHNKHHKHTTKSNKSTTSTATRL